MMKKDKDKSAKAAIGRSVGAEVIHRFRKNRLAVAGLVILALMILVIVLAQFFIPYSTVVKQNFSEKLEPPSAKHWFGTDAFGRDLFARVIYGGRISLFGGLAVVAITFVLGITLGGAAGYFWGKVDNVIMRVVDMLMAIPSALLAMAIVAALGNGVGKLIVALAIAQTPRLTRVVRSSIMSLRNMEFVEAARCCGTSPARIIFKHILPNAMGLIIVTSTLTLGQSILSISSMGFIGLGVASPTPEWGTILSENMSNVRYLPYLGIFPGIFIALSVIAVNFIGDGLRDAFDPKQGNRGVHNG